MVNLKVELGHKTYPLFIGIDILGKFGEIYQLYGYKPRAALLTDLNSKESKYFSILFENFKKRNIEIIPMFLTAEQIENGLGTVQQIALRLIQQQFQSDEPIISLGGSRLGNISAFIAQIFCGGVPYFQMPTTFSAQVVQSVDPICHLNFGSISNIFSIKYEHSLVWSDVGVLKSLSVENFVRGIGYIAHYACLLKNGLFEFLEKNLDEIFKFNLEIIEQIVFRSCQSKIKLLQQSFVELQNLKSNRFGEFVASILIELTHNKIKFGEALLFGMLIEGALAFKSNIFSASHFKRLCELLRRIPYHYLCTIIDQNSLIDFIEHKLSSEKPLPLHLPQELGDFIPYSDYKLSDFVSAIKLILSN